MTKEQAEEKGYQWKNPEERNYKITLTSDRIRDQIKDVDHSILDEIIECAHSSSECNEQCTTAFKIIPAELQFYQRFNLPLPRLCSNCRHYQRMKQRNPPKLWQRKCQCAGTVDERNMYQNTATHFHESAHCSNEFETSYAPERQEIVYCEACYNSELT